MSKRKESSLTRARAIADDLAERERSTEAANDFFAAHPGVERLCPSCEAGVGEKCVREDGVAFQEVSHPHRFAVRHGTADAAWMDVAYLSCDLVLHDPLWTPCRRGCKSWVIGTYYMSPNMYFLSVDRCAGCDVYGSDVLARVAARSGFAVAQSPPHLILGLSVDLYKKIQAVLSEQWVEFEWDNGRAGECSLWELLRVCAADEAAVRALADLKRGGTLRVQVRGVGQNDAALVLWVERRS